MYRNLIQKRHVASMKSLSETLSDRQLHTWSFFNVLNWQTDEQTWLFRQSLQTKRVYLTVAPITMCAFTMCACVFIMAYFLFPVHFAYYFHSVFRSAFLRSSFHSCPTGRTFSIFSKFILLLPITKVFCPQFPCLFSLLRVCVKLLHRQTWCWFLSNFEYATCSFCSQNSKQPTMGTWLHALS